MSVPIGREARRLARRASVVEEANTHIAETLPWLWRREASPGDAGARVGALFEDLKARAVGMEAARQATDALHVAVDAWNAAHPLKAIPAPPAITRVRARNPGWSLTRLARLGRWRPWGRALEACLAEPGGLGEARAAAGLVLACAVRHGGLGDPIFLAALARWLAEPTVPLKVADGLPVWLDLKARGRPVPVKDGHFRDAAAEGGLAGGLRVVSGEDEQGPYALRRWFVDADSLRTIAAFLAKPLTADDREVIQAGAQSRTGLATLVRAALDPDGVLGPPPALLSMIDGAFAEMEATRPRLDAVTAAVARGRLRWASPGTGAWEATFRDPMPDKDAVVSSLETEPWSQDGSDTGGEHLEGDADGLSRREGRAFAALHALLSTATPDRGRDLVAEEGRVTARVFAHRLDAACGEAQWWPSAARLLLDWYRALSESLEPSSVLRYHTAVADLLLACAADLDLAAADGDALTQLFSEILEDDPRSLAERARTRKLLRRLHRFGVGDPRWQLAEVDPAIFDAGPEEAPAFRIAPRLIGATTFARARALVRVHPELDHDGRLAVEAAMILQRRCGLRVSEVCKAELGDLEPTEKDPALFIRPNRYGSNKTRAARRRMRPFALCTAEEGELLRRWIRRRRLLGGAGPLIGLVTPLGLEPIASASLASLISDLLRRAAGRDDVSDHTMRHAALGDLARALAEARGDAHPLVDRDALRRRLSGLAVEEAQAAAEAICPAIRRRDALVALAAHAGHRSAETTVTSYLHGWDLQVFEAVARPVSRRTYDRLQAPLADRLLRIETATQGIDPGPPGGAPRRGAFDPVDLVAALRALEEDAPFSDVATGARVAEADLTVAMQTAEALATLRTRRGTPRLHPPGAARRLAPVEPRSVTEQQEGRTLLRELWGLRRDARADLVWWCAVCLLRATRSNAGLRLIHVHEVAKWSTLMSRLSPRRWVLHLEGPPDTGDRAVWELACPPGTSWRDRPAMNGPMAIARLPRPDSEAPDTRLTRISTDYASGAPLFAAHALAISLGVPPRELAICLAASKAIGSDANTKGASIRTG